MEADLKQKLCAATNRANDFGSYKSVSREMATRPKDPDEPRKMRTTTCTGFLGCGSPISFHCSKRLSASSSGMTTAASYVLRHRMLRISAITHSNIHGLHNKILQLYLQTLWESTSIARQFYKPNEVSYPFHLIANAIRHQLSTWWWDWASDKAQRTQRSVPATGKERSAPIVRCLSPLTCPAFNPELKLTECDTSFPWQHTNVDSCRKTQFCSVLKFRKEYFTGVWALYLFLGKYIIICQYLLFHWSTGEQMQMT